MGISKRDKEILEAVFMWVPKHIIKEKLAKREYETLCARLNGKTYRTISETYKISRSRAMQIFCKAIRKLRWCVSFYGRSHVEILKQIRDIKD